jgi:adenosylcobinamide-phosphate synthase
MPLDRPALLLIILIVEAAVGYPQAVFRVVRHPVVWVGSLITVLERRWNQGTARRRRLAGCVLLVVLTAVAAGTGWAVTFASEGSVVGVIALILVSTALFAQRSLHDHVAAVLRPLVSADLQGAREAVSRIVGRDTAALDAEGIATAAIESLSESLCDGIVAPAFWFLIAGLPGLCACKAINTADSLIGHRDERFRAFGWAAARADDLVNLIPARLAGLFICAAGLGGVRVMLSDAPAHASPNGGWPEAAMAGVLSRQLGGSVTYDGELSQRALLGSGPRPDVASLRSALKVYWRACAILWLVVGGIAWLL